ncbi:prolyl oligopeptidase family serine peptidase [Microbacterium horticulturae]|uniref:Prolyl oligopeptidase family serine peptidase n=1 Tax=Microbacterium horticulturae TaxID=3028316 RepID=A0ABY8C023_9MICO|nr:prolyl oligopeptidase family serine peptidase [Microbacterium sp. KACC 23027]WEG09590.1 prolyl oligopeptidase family serine peptidase [Microbacterium sp. KACC 23027]
MRTTPFDSLDDYIALPRTESIAVSPGGSRVVLGVATLKKDGTGYDRALWEVAADDSDAPARRLTRSVKGESSAVYTADGDLLFLSARPDGDGADDDPAQLWLLPGAGGEARPVTRLAGGVSAIEAVAEASDVVIISAPLLPAAASIEDDARLRADRKKHKVSAILHESYPVRYWDHDLGPDQPHLFALHLSDLAEQVGVERADEDAADDVPAPYPASLPRPIDLTPHPGTVSGAHGVAVTPDGGTVIAALPAREGRDERARLVSIDVATGAHTIVRDEPGVDNEAPVIAHGFGTIAWVRAVKSTPAGPADQELWVSALDGTDARRVAAGWDRWPTAAAFASDDASLLVTADQDGRGPVFRVPLDGGAVQQLTDDDFTYSGLAVDRFSGEVVALRTNWMLPPHPVRLSNDGVTVLSSPVPLPDVPATMTEVSTVVEDGARVRGWLLLPEGATDAAPAPLLLWIHGGPLNSWNAWSWRWNPQLLVARGFAVLLPDPALSTGYGLEFIARGWNSWGAKPYTDLMAITDEVVARGDIDETRTAAMGGSFGGYMANWVAGHTDRFRAIVTHASLWALDQFAGTTDHSGYWQRIFTREAMLENSPHRFVGDIHTPLLVVHGDRDYRVPIGEGLRLWSELNEHFASEEGTSPHRFLYFPDENHWVLKPQHAVVWYQTVFAFLDQHVLDKEWARPDRIG